MVGQLRSSMLGLIVAGFLLVSLPLVVAVITAYASVNRLSYHATDGLVRSVEIAQLSQFVDKAIRTADLTAQKSAVFADEELPEKILELLLANLQQVDRSVEELRVLSRDVVGREQLGFMLAKSAAIQEALAEEPEAAVEQFVQLRAVTDDWLQRTRRIIAQESARSRRSADQTQLWLQRLLAITVPAAGLMTLVFVFLINRPLRQLSGAIRELGTGDFSAPIEVRGPADLEALSDDLDNLRRRLRAAEKQKKQFLRHMSHELKTPLASLLEGTELFVDGSLGRLPDAQSEVADILRRNAQELRHLIENLLDFSAWQENGAELRRSEFDFRRLCRQVLERHKLAMMTRRVTVRTEVAALQITADREKVRTILTNLVSNAVKFAPEGTAIHLRGGASDAGLVLEVADEGPNVPAEERERIFEPFYTGAPPQRRHLRGSGIGLSLVREYVRAHGGSVALVDGEFPGAHFRVELPVAVAPLDAASATPALPPVRAISG